MKTAMQELLDKVNKMESKNIEVIKIYIKEGIEQEKQQIMDSFDSGVIDGLDVSCQQYYKNTFTND